MHITCMLREQRKINQHVSYVRRNAQLRDGYGPVMNVTAVPASSWSCKGVLYQSLLFEFEV